jgi:PAS domain S-box-containing protein
LADNETMREERPPIDAAMFQAAIDAAPEAVLVIECAGWFAYANEQACGLLGYARRELAGLHVWDVDAGMTRARWGSSWDERPQAGTAETSYRRKDGTLVPVDVSTRDLDAGGRRLRVAFARDVSRRRAVTDALRRTQAAVDHAREAIFWIRSDGRFVYVNDAACE